MPLIAQEIPKVGLVMDSVRVMRWLKAVGDAVIAGEPLLEVETEKSVVEIEAAATGRLTQILVGVDQQAAVGDQVAWIESAEAAAAPAASAPRADPRPDLPTVAAVAAVAAAAGTGDAGRIRSTPVARKLAAEHGVDLGAMTGTGPGGRIQLDDVRRAVDAAPGAPPQAPPLSASRRALVRAMTLSNATIPQFTVARCADWTAVDAARLEFAARLPAGAAKPSFNDFLLLAVARALMACPALNATFAGDPDTAGARILPARGTHIGLVVAVEHGLLVPVIHDVERLGLGEIARRRQDAVARGLKGRLRQEETDGATISISNLGAEGPDRFTAIINPPQSAILAVGRRRDRVVARHGAVAIRPMSDLTLTVDHRVADGRLASQFLNALILTLEGSDWSLD